MSLLRWRASLIREVQVLRDDNRVLSERVDQLEEVLREYAREGFCCICVVVDTPPCAFCVKHGARERVTL